MLTRLMVKNFKSIGEPGIDIELRPLTVFVGPNGGGKSSILEALAFLAQNVGKAADKLTLSGELIDYPLLAVLAHRLEQHRWLTIGLSQPEHELTYRVRLRPDTREVTQELLDMKGMTRLKFGIESVYPTERGLKEFLEYDGKRIAAFQGSMIKAGMDATVRPHALLSPDHLLDVDDITYRWGSYDGTLPLPKASVAFIHFAAVLQQRVFLISSQRGAIKPQQSAGEDATWVGRECQHLLVILSRLASPVYESITSRVQRWATEFSASKVWAGVTASNAVSGQYSDTAFNVVLNLNMASQGSRQALGMITQLFWAKPGSIVMIEEPELSLHPGAQDKLPALFADAIKDGKQVMITTHSHYLLLALTEAVKAGLPAEDIAVYEVKKEPETGTTAKRLPVSKDGYIPGWISSFSDADKKLFARRSARAIEKKAKR